MLNEDVETESAMMNKNIVDVLLESITATKCDRKDLRDFYQNIVFEGGTSLIEGMREKFELEITNRRMLES